MSKLVFGLIFMAASFIMTAQEGLPRVLPGEVNSSEEEWAPIASPEGRTLYFTRISHPQNMGDADAADIWITYRYANGQWPRAVNAGAPLNSWQDDRVVGVHESGRRLYLYRPDDHALFYSDRQGRAWQPPMPIAIDSFNLQGKEAHYAFSPNGNVLLLSFAGKGSMGGRDMYACFAKDDSHYSFPQPLGPPANSSADEAGIWLAADGETLYFSSNREGGQGGQDLYLIRRLDGGWANWTLPQNLGPAINTSGDDIFLSMPASGSPVYLLRPSEEGTMDIYEAELPDSLLPRPVVLLTGKIRDAASGEAVSQAKARLRPLEDGPLFTSDTEIIDGDGGFQFILPHGHDFELAAAVGGYFFPVSQPLELSGQALEELDRESSQLLVSLHRDPAYVQRNAEIIGLQFHLRKIDEELIQLREQREALQQKMADSRREDPNWRPASDPELDAIRHRYEQYQATMRDTIVPDAYEETTGGAQELKDMKERYNRYMQYQEKQQEEAAEATQGNAYLWEKADEFENLQKEVYLNLEEGLAPKVEQELSLSMLEAVKQELSPSLSERERQQLELKEDELRREINQSFGGPAGSTGNWMVKGQPGETEWERQLKGDVRTAMEPQVREQLRQDLKEDIRAALANDITYWAKKETHVEIQAELNEKLQMQIEQERRKAASATAGSDIVAPLEPAPASKAAYREIHQDLLLIRAEPGVSIQLNTVVFEPNQPTLKPVAYAELGRVLDFLNQNEHLVVEIGVHAGGQLSHTNALSLTTQRAKAITNYLTGHGIDEARVIPKGYGKAFPLDENNTPEAHRLNQRVEMRVITSGN